MINYGGFHKETQLNQNGYHFCLTRGMEKPRKSALNMQLKISSGHARVGWVMPEENYTNSPSGD